KQRSTSLEAAARNEGMRDFLEKQRGAEVVGDELIYKVNEISLPVKSLTPAQRAALENLIVEWGKEYVGTPDEDLLVSWYKMGAKEDLSNVTIRFAAMGHIVSLWYQIRTMSDQKIDQGTTRRTGVFGGRISEFAQL
ncbi:MAG: hypothetical protein GTN69_08690, partial [Armatimonadetes bacterium]|nr:hypothetical protein [Armatimonadota bacterium]NIO75941.1 hypothetical protein [Armatimonadota bacterium]NIO98753.1 hypothetical protein [Armatimonadota bacterium]